MMDAKSISLKHWLKYIESIHPQQIDFGLQRIRPVAQKAALNQLGCPVVLVGGTNGKGSTVALLAKLLQAMGLRVGAYFSPHLIYFTERIVLNGTTCAEAKLCSAFAQVEKLRGKTPLTFFEFTTLAAFHIFKEEKLDVILLEVGCGGEKDAVNIVEPDLSIITSVGLDHTEWLGDTIAEIGTAKAGILRAHKPAILGIEAQIPSILQKAQHLQSKLILEGRDFDWNDIYKSYWNYQSRFIQIPPHSIPSTSVSLALAALENLWSTFFSQKSLPYDHLSYYLRTEQMPGRFQLVYTKCETIFDVAHNESGAIWLADKFKKLYPQVKTVGVWSSLSDKNLE
ncbi:MAG TPA: Mur ligase family protein, partial [Gammaproteobacteria bacterium]|nr:Mur ligase family protein [Gammaproteobacteria bacterium]